MSRIIAGTAGSLRLAGAAKGTRPTTDRVKESVFAVLETLDAINDSRVLDLYAGTMALGLEAVSRGARSLVGVEKNRSAHSICLKNAQTVRKALQAAGRDAAIEVKLLDAIGYLKKTDAEFDLIFADPPYEVATSEVETLIRLATGAISRTGVLVVEQSAAVKDLEIHAPLELYQRREYGDTAVFFFIKSAQ